MYFESNIGIHNEFLVEAQNIITGETRILGKAYNVVLDQMYTRICNFNSYFVNIHFGTGTGTKSAARTSLFTHLGTKTATEIDWKKDVVNNNIYWKKRIQLMPEEYVGQTITEIGIAYGATSTNLVTHALVTDDAGNPAPFVKTDVDVINIYSTVYFVVDKTCYGGKVNWLIINNELVNYLIGNTPFPTMYFRASKAQQVRIGTADQSIGSSAAIAPADWIKDVANKKITTPLRTFDINTANGLISTIGLGSTDTTGMIKISLPVPDVYNGLQITGESIGTGDGTTKKFSTAWNNIDTSSLDVYVNGVLSGDASYIDKSYLVSKMNNPPAAPGYIGALIKSSRNDMCVSYVNCTEAVFYRKNNINNHFDKYQINLATSYIYPRRFSPSGKYGLYYNASVGTGLLIYDTENGFTQAPKPLGATYNLALAGSINETSFSADDTLLAVAHSNSPYVTIKKISELTTTGGTAIDASLSVPAFSVDFAPDSQHVVATINGSPYVKIYKRNVDDTFTLLTGLPSLSSIVNMVRYSPDGRYLAFALSNSPYLQIWKRTGDTYTALPNPTTTPISAASSGFWYNFLWSPNSQYIGWGRASVYPWLEVYKVTDTAITRLNDPERPNETEGNSSYQYFAWADNSQFCALTAKDCWVLQIQNDSLVYVFNLGLNMPNNGGTVFVDNDNIIFGSVGANSPYVHAHEIHLGTDNYNVGFGTAPAVGALITADYLDKSIPKNTDYLVNMQLSVQFGEIV